MSHYVVSVESSSLLQYFTRDLSVARNDSNPTHLPRPQPPYSPVVHY